MATAAMGDRVSRAGDGLASAGIQWGTRPAEPPMFAVTPRDLSLLAVLLEVGYLSSSQLMLLGWGKDSSQARQRLKRLHDAGLTDKLRPYTPHGSHEWTYRLTSAGFELLVRAERVEPTPVYKPADLHALSYLEHDLQVNGLVLHIARQADAEGAELLLERMPFQWLLRSATINADDEDKPELRERSVAALGYHDHHFHHELSQGGYLEPDALLRGVDHEGRRFSVLIEYDRTRRPSKQVDRLRRYDRFLTSDWPRTRFGTDDISPAVLYITQTARDREALCKVADHELTAWVAADGTTGAEQGTYPGRQGVAFASRDALLSDDWSVVLLPSRPPRKLGPGRGYIPRKPHLQPTQYPLPALFAGPPGAA